ncbi:MAG TPA: ATP-binding protein [Steroidobacteraceae bacterium]|nr:ATP-binding protein [Steroidobacteraceae bacterium]
MSATNWVEANQRVLAAEIARLKVAVSGRESEDAGQDLDAAREAMPSPAAIDVLTDIFGLSPFERDTLLLCAGVELDAELATACADLGVPGGQAYVTFALALARLPTPHWSALAPIRPLRLWRLVEVRDDRALSSSRLSIDERVLHYLTGINYLDCRLRAQFRLHAEPGLLSATQERLAAQAEDMLRNGAIESPIVQLTGDDAGGQLEIARRCVHPLGLTLHVLRSCDIPAQAHEADAMALLWSRESSLLHSALCLQADPADLAAVDHFTRRIGGICFVSSSNALALHRASPALAVNRPAPAEQKQLWIHALGDMGPRLNGSLDAIVGQFRLGTDTIIRNARSLSAGDSPASLESDLWRTCRNSVRKKLDDLAQRVEPVATWEDLVLPEPQVSTLRQVVAHVRQRSRVFESWGFGSRSARGLGVSVLFAGESGTGKTMAAEVLANELRLDLYRIDLAGVVSKYIGETEKNLRRVFDAAEDSGVILLFDEADALFGKRSEVKDSHDRYANIEVSYLLQRMEEYRGLAILTTNLKGALDTAFQRRLRFVVPFPFPDQQLRERIWRGVFPAASPLGAVDHRRLSQLNVSGGNIRNIALNAAFIAAETESPIGMGHLLQAARSEAAKRERPFSDAEIRGWV